MNIKSNSSIVILTGAGISKESGLATFRGNGGLWQGVRVEEVASPNVFAQNSELVHSFYNVRKEKLLDAEIQPNAAHYALVELEKKWWGDFLLVTQNVDDLHDRAGSNNLLHMHGELLKGRCVSCDKTCDWHGPMDLNSVCPFCSEKGCMRVDVVWFGEMPMHMEQIYQVLEKCDLFISIGTSGNVYPAAGFVDVVSRNGSAQTVEINLEPSLNASQFSQGLYGPATIEVPKFVEKLLSVS